MGTGAPQWILSITAVNLWTRADTEIKLRSLNPKLNSDVALCAMNFSLYVTGSVKFNMHYRTFTGSEAGIVSSSTVY